MVIRVPKSLVVIFVCCHCIVGVADENRWWPVQSRPTGIVRTRERGFSFPEQVLVQSVAGLAAKAVNQGRADEMVWISTDNADIETWFARWLKKNSSVEVRGEFSPWELVDRYVKRNLIRGYILYSIDQSEGQLNDHRKVMNPSINVATSLAGLLDGVVIDESLEQEARGHGLTLLMDARDKRSDWCFATYRDQFNRKMLCAQDPKKSNLRDLAIAQQSLVIYGADKPLESVLDWLDPLSPIAGWNGGDEFETTRLSSVHGHIQTATDWCTNLPVLMSGSEQNSSPPEPNFDPSRIDFSDRSNSISFVLSDGDNVQWFETSFVHANNSYWDSHDRGKIPFGWSCCHSQLIQLCPVIIDHLSEQRTRNDAMIEWGGGYYYPDLFAKSRPEREALLAKQASRTWGLMRRTGMRIIGFNVAKVSSTEALKAYETFAKQTDGLTAILVFQYAPYEGGAGVVYWVKDARGVEIPVIAARYSIWGHSNNRERSGTPAKVASEIRDSTSGNQNRDDWVVVHAWSYFRRSEDSAPTAEDMPQEDAASKGGVRGYSPAVWCAERLTENVKVVHPEELCWRVRMKHDPITTRKLLKQ